MRRLLIATIAVLVVCLGVCTWGLVTMNRILDDAHALTVEVFAAMEENDRTAVREGLVALATMWKEKSELLELLCDHDDLHNVGEHIIEARICLEYTDREDFFSKVALIGEGIEHIRDEEALTLANLY